MHHWLKLLGPVLFEDVHHCDATVRFVSCHTVNTKYRRCSNCALRHLMVWCILAFRQNCSETWRATHILSREKCSPGNAVFGSIRFMQIFEGVRSSSVQVKCGRWKLQFSVLSFTVFRRIYGHTTAFTWCDCRWPWRYFKVIRLFYIKFLINGGIRQKLGLLYTTNRKSYTSFRLVPLFMTLKYIWRSFHPRLSFPRPFQQSLVGFRVARSLSNS